MRWHRYVALGDSTTEGLHDGNDTDGYIGFADRLAEHVADAQHAQLLYANLAVRGRKARDLRTEQLPVALELRPDLATVAVGMNDVLGLTTDLRDTAAHLNAVFAALTAAGATVLTFTFPDPSPVMPIARLLNRRIHRLNTAILTAAARHHVIVADLRGHPLAADSRYWHHDRFHANSAGHTTLAAALAECLGIPVASGCLATPPVSRWTLPAEARWIRQHFLDYLLRHARGVKLGAGRAAKRPALTPVPAARSRQKTQSGRDSGDPSDTTQAAGTSET